MSDPDVQPSRGVNLLSRGGKGRLTVLHVDDDTGFAELVARFLEHESDAHDVDIDVVTETNARAGLDRLAADDVDCVVSDYEMPNMDGLAFLEQVRADHGTLPFILFTGRGSETVASEAISAGVTDYLQKQTGSDQYALLANRVVNAVKQHRAEREVHQGYLAMDTARQGICLLDTGGRFHYVNQQYGKLCGRDPDELVGATLSEVFGDERAAVICEAVERAVATGTTQEYEDELSTGSGTRHFAGVMNPLVGHSDDVVLWIGEEITDRKRLERDLELALEAAEMGAWELDLRTNESPTRTPRHDRIFGYDEPVDDWSFERFLEHVHPADRGWVERSFETALQTGTWEFECRITRVDGVRRWIAAQGECHYNGTGDPVRALGLVQDITQRKEHEAELRRKNARLTEFASVVSHDLRSPITTARGRIDLAKRECDSAHLDAATDALDRSFELVDDLLTLAREGTEAHEPTRIDLADVVEDCWQISGEVTARLVVETDQVIEADRGQLRQLLENLFRNSIEHGPSDRGEQDSTATEMRADETDTDDWPVVTVVVGDLAEGFYVEDDGTGIPPTERDAIFEPGYTTGTGGYGYGLSIVRDIAEEHGWDVAVTESDRGGARFEITGV